MNLPSPDAVAADLVQEVDEADGTVTLRWGATNMLVRAGLAFTEASSLAGTMRDDLVRLLRGYERALIEAERQAARLQGQVEALRGTIEVLETSRAARA